MRLLRTGDPCPCCGQPIPLTNPDALRLLALTADLLGLPDHPAVPEPVKIPPELIKKLQPALTKRCNGCPDSKWKMAKHVDSLCCYHHPYDGKWVGAIKVCPMDAEGVR